jgi:hypothetical protein
MLSGVQDCDLNLTYFMITLPEMFFIYLRICAAFPGFLKLFLFSWGRGRRAPLVAPDIISIKTNVQ